MLCRMKQQAEHIGRQLRSSHPTMLEKLIVRGVAKLIERAIDLRRGRLDEIGQSGRRIAGIPFSSKYFLLRVTQPFTARVREQAIQRSTEMFDVETNRSRATGPEPDMLGWNL